MIISLETLFVYEGEPKSKTVSCKVSELISKPGYEEEISSFLEKIYDYKSKIVHSGSVFISKKDMDTLIHFTRIALFQVISLHYKYSNKINYLNKKYSNVD